MKRHPLILPLTFFALGICGFFFLLISLSSGANQQQETINSRVKKTGLETITYLQGEDGKKIAVRITSPQIARYETAAPVLIYVPTFFTGEDHGFESLDQATDLGLIEIDFLYPGRSDTFSGAKSEGTDDYGGEYSIKALATVVDFASGNSADIEGNLLENLTSVTPEKTNIGLYAFSHPGIAATRALAAYGSRLPIAWYVGRENPTIDKLSAVEIGHFTKEKTVEINPFYQYPRDYTKDDLTLSYASVRWSQKENAPYFDRDTNGIADTAIDYVLGSETPKMFGKRYYSRALLHALKDNGSLTTKTWPSDLATPEEADALWPERETTGTFPAIARALPDLKILLLFAKTEHVQPNLDRPSIHQLYDGFHDAGLWVRLNPDDSYLAWASPLFTTKTEHSANTEPADWEKESFTWAYQNAPGAPKTAPLAAVAEMMDRTQNHRWDDNLSSVLTNLSAPTIDAVKK